MAVAEKTRSVRLLVNAGGLLAIMINDGKKREAYQVDDVPSQIGGRGFQLTKATDGAVYHCRVAGQFSTCDCPGGTYRGACKHLGALQALVSKNAI